LYQSETLFKKTLHGHTSTLSFVGFVDFVGKEEGVIVPPSKNKK
jgi:hypothetical protein